MPAGSNYPAEKKKRFVAWLTSANIDDPATLPETTPGGGRVTLVGSGSLGSGEGREKLQIHLQPTPLTSGRQQGSLAWWIAGDERLYPLCETRWRHDPRSCSVVFINSENGIRSPRVLVFPDYREAKPDKP